LRHIPGPCFSFLILIRWSLGIKIAIPFFDPIYISFENLSITTIVFVIPFFTAMAIAFGPFSFKKCWNCILRLKEGTGLWILIAGIVLGFMAVTGFFLVKIPHGYLEETLLLQQNRPYQEFPSLIAMIRIIGQSPLFMRMTFFNVLIAIPILIIVLNKRIYSRSDHFLWVAMAVSLILCQGFHHLPRYYASLFPFLFLGISGLIPPAGEKPLMAKLRHSRGRLEAGMLLPLSLFFLFLCLSIVLLTNYTAHGIQKTREDSTEEYVYRETFGYLKGIGARKVYSVNPIFIALAPNLNTTLNFDTYALLWLKMTPPDEIIRNMIHEGVDYVVLDTWVNHWTYPYDREAKDLVRSIRGHGKLMRVIAPDSPCRAEIYLLGH